MWELAVNYAWHTHNLYPLTRNASRNGKGPRPLQELSQNNVDETECDRRIEYILAYAGTAVVLPVLTVVSGILHVHMYSY